MCCVPNFTTATYWKYFTPGGGRRSDDKISALKSAVASVQNKIFLFVPRCRWAQLCMEMGGRQRNGNVAVMADLSKAQIKYY